MHAACGLREDARTASRRSPAPTVGPGATNMVTGAALATVNHASGVAPSGDVFASRALGPGLQQLEVPWAGDVSVNDVFRPVSRYFDRIMRPEQIVPAALAAMRVLVSPAETGAVTLALPQDVQAEAFDVPEGFLDKRTWHIERRLPEATHLARAAELIAARAPLIGRAVRLYSGATEALRKLFDATGIPSQKRRPARARFPFVILLRSARSASTARPPESRAREADLVS